MAVFAGYEVLGRVAQGSTGVVWQARQVELDRLVAIKELSPVLLQAPGFLQRFRAEAQTLAVLDDPHVVRIFDYVEEPARAYLVQEWVDGAPLASVLQQHGTLTAEQSLGVLRGGLIGLAHAHSRGLVHRDISPANILLDRGGTSKLLDFGLAARTDQGIAPGAATSIGTPAFSSPEAVTGAPMTTRSDVYSAAAVLYLLLSGRLPYPGDIDHVLQAHLTAPVPHLDQHGPDLGDLLARGMAKTPTNAPDAAAFLAELEQAATRRYGAGWLNRASVAGLATATTAAGTTAALTTGATATAAPATAAAQAVTYGATHIPTILAGQTAATATRTGARILGMPMAAAITALVVVIAAIAATVVLLTSSEDPPAQTLAEETANTSQESLAVTTEPAPTTAATQVPAFSGTYSVTRTITDLTGDFAFGVGDVVQVEWQVTSNCPAGPCEVSIVSSSGLQFFYGYVGGVWTYAAPPTVSDPCLDPTGTGLPLTRVVILEPTTPYDPNSATPIPALSGTGTDIGVGRDGNPTGCVYTLEVTRIGD